MTHTTEPLRDSREALDDAGELAERLRSEGYLYMPRVLPEDRLTPLRRELLAIARASGWIEAHGDLDAAHALPDAFCVDPEPRYRRVYRRMYRLEAAHALPHEPTLASLMAKIVRAPVLVHPRPVLRMIFPGCAFTTPAHQDFPVVQGTPETYTAWIPLMDCSEVEGVLELAPGSHTCGVYDVVPSLGTGGSEIVDLPRRWARSDMRVGDLVIFHSLTVHRATPNVSQRLRVSLDCRCQSVHEPVNRLSLEPSRSGVDWEEIYAGWGSERYQYYWRDLPLRLTEFDPSGFEERDRRAFEMAASGDPRCVSALQRIAVRDPSADVRQRASRFLASLADSATLNGERDAGAPRSGADPP